MENSCIRARVVDSALVGALLHAQVASPRREFATPAALEDETRKERLNLWPVGARRRLKGSEQRHRGAALGGVQGARSG